MTEPDAPVAPALDCDTLSAALFARTAGQLEAAEAAAERQLELLFPQSVFKLRIAKNAYSDDTTYANLLRQEAPKSFREWFQAEGKTVADLKAAVGEVQYVAISASPLAIFGDGRPQQNKGWSVRVLGFPALRLAALGLASSWGGSMAQGAIAAGSKRIRDSALDILTRTPEIKELLAARPSATAQHFDERGLMTSPVLSIGDLDISSYEGGAGARLRLVRNTTVKKDLATFFAIRGMTEAAFRAEGSDELARLATIAKELARP